MSLKYTSRVLVTAPIVEPVTLSEAKTHMRITHTDEDDLIKSYIEAARVYTEQYLSRSLISQTWDFNYNLFPASGDAIEIPLPPLKSITSVKYYDGDEVQQTWSDTEYTVDTDNIPPLIYENMGESYPSTRVFRKSVTIRAVTGYADSGASPVDLADNVPSSIKTSVMMLVAHLYENREIAMLGLTANETPMSYQTILAPYKLRTF